MNKAQADNKEALRRCLAASLAVTALLCLLGLIVSDSWTHRRGRLEAVSQETLAGMPHDGLTLTQVWDGGEAAIQRLALQLAPVGSDCAGEAEVSLLRAGETLWQETVSLSGAGAQLTVAVPSVQAEDGDTLRFVFRDPDGTGLLPAVWMGSFVGEGRFSVPARGLNGLRVDGEERSGRLCFTADTVAESGIMRWWWLACAAAALLGLTLTCLAARGRWLWPQRAAETVRRYSFLLEQLVRRNFNTKYRQSLLGVLWSFLNPLLTMGVQYVVFSTIFRSGIPNFPVYLLCGIVLFNFFTEAANLGMESIVMNGPLLTKVAMPKAIFPLSKTLSALINLVISLVPLMGLMLLTGTPWTRALLLTPLCLAFTAVFALGMAMLLSALYVFFRDARFLWSVVSLLWTYATPIFYPESIIPAALLPVYRLNPMYQFITFLREIVLDGAVPPPGRFAMCALLSGVTLLAGWAVFRRKEDEFVFHL